MGRIIGDTAIVWLTLGGTLRMTGLQPWYARTTGCPACKYTGSTLTTYIYYTSPAGGGQQLHRRFRGLVRADFHHHRINALMGLIGMPGG
jgi:phosphate transport system permease protein